MKLLSVFLCVYLWFIFPQPMASISSIAIHGTSYPIVFQSPGDQSFISQDENTFTLYYPAAWYKVTWLLAHNTTTAGQVISSLQVGDSVTITIDGISIEYKITEIKLYTPSNWLFSTLTTSPGLILQTCAGDSYLIVKGES